MSQRKCPLCMCVLRVVPDALPVCTSCFEKLERMPNELRMELCLKVMDYAGRQQMADNLAEMLSLVRELIEKGREDRPFLFN